MIEPGLMWVVVFWWLVGLGGCALAARYGVSRLVGAVVLSWALCSLGVTPSQQDALYASSSRVEAERTLRELRDSLDSSRRTLVNTGVTETAVQEFEAAARLKIEELESQAMLAENRDRAAFMSVVFPLVLLTAIYALIGLVTVGVPSFRALPTMLAGTLVSCLAMLGLAMLLRQGGWEGLSWGSALALAVAVGVTRYPGNTGQDDRLWRHVLEPLLYGLAGAMVARQGAWDWVLIVLVLIAFVDFKAMGAAMPAWLLGHRGFVTSLCDGLGVASGGAFSVALALAAYSNGWIHNAGFTAVVFVNVTASLLLSGGGRRRGLLITLARAVARN